MKRQWSAWQNTTKKRGTEGKGVGEATVAGEEPTLAEGLPEFPMFLRVLVKVCRFLGPHVIQESEWEEGHFITLHFRQASEMSFMQNKCLKTTGLKICLVPTVRDAVQFNQFIFCSQSCQSNKG